MGSNAIVALDIIGGLVQIMSKAQLEGRDVTNEELRGQALKLSIKIDDLQHRLDMAPDTAPS